MRFTTFLTAILAALLAGLTATVFADDGKMERHPVTSAPGQTADPEPIAEHAFIQYLNFYVPAQKSNDTLLADVTSEDCGETGIPYVNIDLDCVETALYAKPLIAFALYGPVIAFEDFSTSGFQGHGRRDAWASVSLDDGETWKKTNLSKSADDSSFETSTPLADPAVPYVDFVINSETPAITAAYYSSNKKRLTVTGAEAPSKGVVEIRNARNFEVIGTANTKKKGTFTLTLKQPETVPCVVQAGFTDSDTWGGYHKVGGAPEDCVGTGSEAMITAYPGDVTNGTHAMAGNFIIAAWQSKFCRGGSPAWGEVFIEERFDDVVAYLAKDELNPAFDPAVDLYLNDVFQVAGSQGSTDYREQEEYPGEYDDVGEVPNSCLWTARGVLREYSGTDTTKEGTTQVVWFNKERLTSGRRDVNRIETACVANAGCAISWQEDPKGLRPGEGGGPGTGWSGATTHSKTDVWFSFIRWEDFDVIYQDDIELQPLGDLDLDLIETNRPKPGIPMMIPVRLSNNDRCKTEYELLDGEFHYCDDATASLFGIRNQCIDQIAHTSSGTAEICVADTDGDLDGDLPNIANTAASRPRLSLQPRDSDGDGITDDAWVIVFAEEDKGMGAFGFDSTVLWAGGMETYATPCGDPDASKLDTCIQADIGKNILWYTFAMGTPQTSAALLDDFGLVNNLVAQGAQLNQPEVNWHTGTFFPPMNTEDMWGFGDYDYLIFNTEIARRSSMMAQSITKANASQSKLVALPLWKQGTMNKGGPADIMSRRFLAPTISVPDPDNDGEYIEVIDESMNPYDVANMECAWYDGEGLMTPGLVLFDPATAPNPYYPKGLCTAPAINLSARTPYECTADGSSQGDGVCNAENLTCTYDASFGQLCVPGTTTDGSPDDPLYRPGLDKALSWYECPGANTAQTGTRTDLPGCGGAIASTILEANLDDQSWYNPVDIAKGHRGFLDGDFVQMLYGWSPNYKQNTVGHDHYNLYLRRSFNGGLTWTTTPSSFTASDGLSYSGAGTVTCETLRDGESFQEHNHICTTYVAGDPEQSRNVSQLQSRKYTVLDPRYTPTGTNLGAGMPDTAPDWAVDNLWLLFDPITPTDIRDPSRFFVVYETGDNTTVATGEAEPLDLFYGRGVIFGDHYQVWAEDKPTLMLDECYPNTTYEVEHALWAEGLGFCNEFDDLEGKKDQESGEASVTASAAGDFLYAIWAQENFIEDPVTELHEFEDADAMFRRIWFLDEYIADNEDKTWTLPGTGNQTNQ